MCNLLTASQLDAIRQQAEYLRTEQVLTEAEQDLIALVDHLAVVQKQIQIAHDAIQLMQPPGNMADAQTRRSVLVILKEVAK